MKTHLECIPCFARQALEMARMGTEVESLQKEIARESLKIIIEADFETPPPLLAQKVSSLIRRMTGIADPYAKSKRRQNRFAMELYPEMKEIVRTSRNPFETAARLAIAGNIIDMGIYPGIDHAHAERSIREALDAPILAETLQSFHDAVQSASSILYLADNCGEIVLDRLLVEELPREKVTFAVRGGPILNDATLEDAIETGITEIVVVIDNGDDAPGTWLPQCSDEFRRRFESADVIISKGQGNYETLDGEAGNIFFLLRAKCPVIARAVGCPLGSAVLMKNKK
ncbi:MAG TPA: ARMT1-like domain-containing protein [Candidatus Sumerlaeota bacterium]|nr:MAG: hypothetical protein BWY12_00328 [candidate division BRC1 bacterium ADurb.Bin183]HOE62151.1 ARMT1-like domain-containing protein [Candidatus Sumerlaeota bacterium]HRR30216.1 ARMT1-like domain-containing protein [Candidatus Sumerlaeia bacterium]HON49066.1 ARMT1-like domain-containing protein [Candidatus Sumerlaeota bacterium]HOR64327.1 ARMT1-like domain-containing protein [Candidatus Sumerlaeota bacterium]